MQRRQFSLLMAAIAGRMALVTSPLGFLLEKAWARDRRRLLPAQTDVGSLIYEDPARLDPRHLPITPISQFGTMGLTEHHVNVSRWRLSIAGAVTRPLSYSLDRIKALPASERDVLLICPGVFAYYARWQGVYLNAILQQAGVSLKATDVDVSGPTGESQKRERFTMAQVRREKLFLAYGVNGVPLPEKHGFPLRLVAEDQVGSQWVKFVDKIEAVVNKSMSPGSVDRNPSQGPAFTP
jgi:DMSO/TMAO reductase YedYZ molybdopterin-dependent catalytic subunit